MPIVPRLASELPDEITDLGANDYLVGQKDGESKLSKLKPAAIAPADIGAMATSHAANSITGFGASAAALGSSAAGTATTVSRSDHVHAMPTAANVGALPATGGTISGNLVVSGTTTLQNYLSRTSGAYITAPGQSTTIPLYSFNSDPDTGIGNHANNAIGLITNSALRLGIGNGGMYPATPNAFLLGDGTYYYSSVYANNFVDVSDQRLKTDIIDAPLGLDFIQALRPVQFRWIVGGRDWEEKGGGRYKDRPGVRPHYGLLAQQVKSAIDAIGATDFAGYVHDPTDDSYGLRMHEFIAPLIKAVQELAARIEALEQSST